MLWDHEGFVRSGLVFVNAEDVPLSVRIESCVCEEEEKLMTERRERACRVVSARHAVAVVNKMGLNPAHGNFAALKRGLGCSRAFAKKIIEG